MILEKHTRVNLLKYFILTYIIFWILLVITGIFSMVLELPVIIVDIMKNVSAWSPTFALLILFRKLYPNRTLKKFLLLQVNRKIKPMQLILSLAMQVGIIVLALFIYALVEPTMASSIQIKPLLSLIPLIFINLTSGPLGEELGWRSYALQTLQKKYNPFYASLILGLVWGFWHLPLWLLSGYSGLDLLYYILAFLGGITGTAIIITYFYNKTKNILIAVWIHFWFNFLLSMLSLESEIFLQIFMYVAALYVVVAIILGIVKKSEFFEKQIHDPSSNLQ